MRIFTIAQVLQFDESSIGLAREKRVAAVLLLNAGQVVADGTVVLADAVECCNGQRKFCLVSKLANSRQFSQHRRVLRRFSQHGHILPVLGRAAHHGRAANVDVLNCLFEGAAGLGDCCLEWVQVDHQ